MSKVIVERPRTGGYGGKSKPLKGYKKRLDRQFKTDNCEEVLVFESNAPGRCYGWDCKQLSERLGPLRKFLQSRVGCLWNDVFSEICENIRITSAVQSHVRDHVDWEVEKNVTMIDGIPYDEKGFKVYERFYVHPDTGVLCANMDRRRYRNKPYIKPYVEGKDANHQYHCIKNVWYEVELVPFPKTVKTTYGWSNDFVKDALHKGSSHRYDCQRRYGSEVYAISKRQLNGKEIKKLNLWETPQGIAARNEK
jgi:hypothetical protein